MDASFRVILGLPGQGMLLHLDTLSLFFIALLVPQIIAASLAGMRSSGWFWLLVAGMVLVLLAGETFALIFGLGLIGVTSWCLAARAGVKQAYVYAGTVVFVLGCLVPALILPVSPVAFMLVVLGTGAMAGLVPFCRWLPPAFRAVPEAVAGLMAGGGVNIVFYILIRYVFITSARSQPPWWGDVLMVVGALTVISGALRAALEVDLRDVLAWATVATSGLITVALGIALHADISGNLALSGLALQAALFCIMAHSLFKPLLFIGAGEVRRAVGTTSLNWLGGLMRGMPRAGVLMLLGAAGMAALPLGPAFAPLFLLVHAVIALALRGGFIACFGCAVLLAVLGLGGALLLAASVKIIGLGFLGRPRSLHAAAAEDAQPGPFLGMALLGALCLPLALVPGPVLFLCAPVINFIVPLARTAPLTYAPLTLCLLAGLALLAAGIVQTRLGGRGVREVHAWNGGFGRPPAWLPFGDPHTQISASGFVTPLMVACGRMVVCNPVERFLVFLLWRLYARVVKLVRRISHLPARLWLACLFSALLLVLLIFNLVCGG